ncbi:M67 family metallopeptidase [Halorarum halophilum]|uniref:M67 family metallopeptidase n=1 Tax=Halorarum halophilum TaxID=2743090 RepID=A0A7D5KMN7_9EURY|nr:desampylase [Halobaculum halophilum]QLG27842.1 M67 family metallopeptidase [Halobaculum halophilum]
MTSSNDRDPEATLVLPTPVRETLHERATDGAPEEVCGVLVGRRGAHEPFRPDRVQEAIPVPNVAASPRTRYELDPAETLSVVEGAEAAGDDVVGFYHSHPRGPIEPSPTDRERATWTGYVYTIVSPDDLAAYRWTGDEFRRLRVETP